MTHLQLPFRNVILTGLMVLLGVLLLAKPAAAQVGACTFKDGKCYQGVTREACSNGQGSFAIDHTCPLTFTPNVPIPGLFSKTVDVDNTLFSRYVSAFYIFFAGVAGIIAVVVMMWGGFHYITSAGNSQKMAQGRDIINNAIIGLILLFTSYLILNLINPNLTRLTLPTLAVLPQIAQTSIYCEASSPGSPQRLAAAAANARCGREVEYESADGVTATCISLAVDPSDQADDIACAPVSRIVDGVARIEFVKRRAVEICENDDVTSDTNCSSTQSVLGLQPWLRGGCKKADVQQTLVTGKDVCRYLPYYTCPSDWGNRIACGQAGSGNSPCWDGSKPRVYTTNREAIRSHCVDPRAVPKTISYIDGACCQRNLKPNTVCSLDGCRNFEAEVSCAGLNSQPGNYLVRVEGGAVIPGGSTCGTTGQTCCAAFKMYYADGLQAP